MADHDDVHPRPKGSGPDGARGSGPADERGSGRAAGASPAGDPAPLPGASAATADASVLTDLALAEAEQTDRIDHGPSWFQILWASKKARVGVVLLGLYVLIALAAPLIAPYRGDDTTFAPVLLPSAEHWMGTTTQGADIFSQLIWGTRVSLIVGLFGGLFATVLGLIVGLTSGYFEGTWIDDVLSLVTNVALVVPTLPLIITLMAYSEVRSVWFTILIIGIISWAGAARSKRSLMITLRHRDFVTAAKFAGDRTPTIIFREILPQMTSLVAAGFFGAATGAIGAEAGLSFLGLGNTESISWGTMLYQAQLQGALAQGLWVWLLVPGLALSGLIMALTLINFGIDLISNPHLREDG
ncbi:ABC transporter permease subunit [Brachybacterium sp. J153]|uniref:ABC transporter permease subunit n=1 Tax=Brachybacterium sp. J153 TaxID=3116488 RepID=UPI002E780737|nr:ABC transporter permease subunit [Brachybacterium sp. J153]MEE1618592.1 ABC transporter permease subunit [Brachybacterium sp. J153]